MENQSHYSILFEHELEVDGVIYRELKSLNREVLVHTRSIGDKITVKRINSEGSGDQEVMEANNMTRLEAEAFQEEWSKNWNPNLGQQEGGIKGVFKKLLNLIKK